jgi:hypothetical protein
MIRDEIFTTDFMNKLEKLSVNVKNISKYGSAGSRKSNAKGMSVEFSDYRKYNPSDDYRRIDWNAYGKFRKLYVKLFMEEKEAVYRIFIDNSKSMSFSDKNVMALRLSAAFSYLALCNLDKVLLNPINAHENNIFLGQGKNSFMKYINYLDNMSFNDYNSSFDKIKRVNFNGSGISIILSDLFTADNIEDIIKYLAYNNQQILIIHILSPEEINPLINGRIKLVDSETGQENNLMITPGLLRKYRNRLEKFCDNISNLCNKYGAYYLNVKSTDPIEKIILEDLIDSFILL